MNTWVGDVELVNFDGECYVLYSVCPASEDFQNFFEMEAYICKAQPFVPFTHADDVPFVPMRAELEP